MSAMVTAPTRTTCWGGSINPSQKGPVLPTCGKPKYSSRNCNLFRTADHGRGAPYRRLTRWRKRWIAAAVRDENEVHKIPSQIHYFGASSDKGSSGLSIICLEFVASAAPPDRLWLSSQRAC